MATAEPGVAGVGALDREFTAVLELSPAKGDIRTAIGKQAGDTVTIQLTERIR